MVEILRYVPTSSEAMMKFATSLTLEDRNFLKEDASDPAVLDRWARKDDVDRFVAIKDGAVVDQFQYAYIADS